MAHSLLILFPLLLARFCNAALPSEHYWHKVMPNTPIPDAIRVFMYPDVVGDEKTTFVEPKPKGASGDVGKGGVNVKTSGTTVTVGPNGKPGVYVNTPYHKGNPVRTYVYAGNEDVNTPYHKGNPVRTYYYGGNEDVNTPYHKGNPVRTYAYAGNEDVNTPYHKGNPVRTYVYAGNEDQIHDDPSLAYFFLEKDLHANQKMNLQFMKTTPGATFLPRQTANSIPFSSSKYPEILAHFSVAPGSVKALDMKITLQDCEEPAVKGEAKYCATSLESMVDFTTSKLGTSNVRVLATKVDSKESPKQLYTIAGAPEKVEAAKSVACHSQRYPYAVFYCHETRATKAYLVPFVGADGSKVEAVAVCHEDTSAWSPKYVAFQLLKVKPGTVPICHFLPQDHLVWVPASK